jgi:hypothetical protein
VGCCFVQVEVEVIRRLVDSYFNIVKRNLSDTVPKVWHVVRRLLRASSTRLQLTLLCHCSCTSHMRTWQLCRPSCTSWSTTPSVGYNNISYRLSTSGCLLLSRLTCSCHDAKGEPQLWQDTPSSKNPVFPAEVIMAQHVCALMLTALDRVLQG